MIAVFRNELFNEFYLNFQNSVFTVWSRLVFFANLYDFSVTVALIISGIFKFKNQQSQKKYSQFFFIL